MKRWLEDFFHRMLAWLESGHSSVNQCSTRKTVVLYVYKSLTDRYFAEA